MDLKLSRKLVIVSIQKLLSVFVNTFILLVTRRILLNCIVCSVEEILSLSLCYARRDCWSKRHVAIYAVIDEKYVVEIVSMIHESKACFKITALSNITICFSKLSLNLLTVSLVTPLIEHNCIHSVCSSAPSVQEFTFYQNPPKSL